MADPVTADELLAEARTGLKRRDPPAASVALEAGAVLESRCDPASPACDERVCDPGLPVDLQG